MQSEDGIGGNECGVAFVPAVGGVDPAAVLILEGDEFSNQILAPVVNFALSIGDGGFAPGGERLSKDLIKIIQPLKRLFAGHVGIGVEGVVFLNPFEGSLNPRVVAIEFGVNITFLPLYSPSLDDCWDNFS